MPGAFYSVFCPDPIEVLDKLNYEYNIHYSNEIVKHVRPAALAGRARKGLSRCTGQAVIFFRFPDRQMSPIAFFGPWTCPQWIIAVPNSAFWASVH
jgi:hypothetical protein